MLKEEATQDLAKKEDGSERQSKENHLSSLGRRFQLLQQRYGAHKAAKICTVLHSVENVLRGVFVKGTVLKAVEAPR